MPRLFISYSHRDETWKDRAVRQLAVLATEGLAVWEDRQIAAGDGWQEEIGHAIDECDAALLLVSAHFLNSPFVLGEEVPRLLQRRQGQCIRVIPVILSPCRWTRIPWLKQIQARPKDGRPLSGMSEHEAEAALSALAGEIADLLLPRLTKSAAIPAAGHPRPSSPAARVWAEKLAYLQEQEAISSDPAQRFTLRKQIEEAEGKLVELGSCVKAGAPGLDRAGAPESNALGADPWSQALADARFWPDPSAPHYGEFRTAALRLAPVCWTQHRAARSVLPNDPWVDESLPTRTLAQLRDLTRGMEGLRLNPAEAALLCLAPLICEAVFARGSERTAACDPLGLDDTGTGEGLRAALEKVHGAHPRLLRKAARLRAAGEGAAADQVALWLMHRTLLREPAIWLPPDPHKGLLDGPVLDAILDLRPANRLVQEALDPKRLLELARCGHYTPSQIDRRDRTGAFEDQTHCADGLGDHLVIRERLLAYLLLVAGAMALDPRVLSEVLVEHVGVSHTPPLPELTAQIAMARWQGEHPTRSLKAVCTHPAVDCALAEQVAHANTLLAAAHRAAVHRDCAPLAGLPNRLDADGIRPADTESGPAYRTPHLRFRLAQDQVLELLMGESLYGDRALAIRELYQNALDACRYADARLTYLKRLGKPDPLDRWTGRIRFHQGIDEQGRIFIECEDNGIGMGLHELTETFTQAGRRFADTPEFLDEKSEWLAQDVHLWPNSQFGIGVLSYFMLADDFEVETCRMDRQGKPGETLTATISGSGSLIRVRGGMREMAGTRVRLWLSRAEAHGQRISVVKTLEDLLWVADFRTEVSDGQRTLRWTAGRLGHDDNHAVHAATHATDNPDFWWQGASASLSPLARKVLADGLATESDKNPPHCVVNLRGQRRPRLTIDRKRALSWESDWPSHAAIEEAGSLLEWAARCAAMVILLAEHYPLAADRFWAAIEMQGIALPIANAYWPLRDNLANTTAVAVMDNSIDGGILPSAGCFAPDMGFYVALHKTRKKEHDQLVRSAISIAYGSFPACMALPRIKALLKNVRHPWTEEAAAALRDIPAIVPRPSDGWLLSEKLNGKAPWLDRECSRSHVFRAAVKLDMQPSEIVKRLHSLGFVLLEPQPDWNAIGALDEFDRAVISLGSQGAGFRWEREVPADDVLHLAAQFQRLPERAADRLRVLGFMVPGTAEEWNLLGLLDESDLELLPAYDDYRQVWSGFEIKSGHVLQAAAHTEKSAADISTSI